MNFQDLLTKMKQIDEGTVEECGMASMPPKQQDNVNMNVTMSGNGAGGIKDLINILKNIEQGEEPTGHDAVIIGNDEISDVERDLDDSYNNEPNPEVAGIDAVTPTGNDIHSKDDEAEKVNGGGNPWNQTEVDEALVNRLSAHYRRIKGDQETDEGSEIDRINAQGFDDPLPQGAYRTPQGQVQYASPARGTPHPDDDATLNNMAAWATQKSREIAMQRQKQGKTGGQSSRLSTLNPNQVSGGANDLWEVGQDEYEPGIQRYNADPNVSVAGGAIPNPRVVANQAQQKDAMSAWQGKAMQDMYTRMQTLQAQGDADDRAWFAQKHKEMDAKLADLKRRQRAGERVGPQGTPQASQPASAPRRTAPAGYRNVSGMSDNDW